MTRWIYRHIFRKSSGFRGNRYARRSRQLLDRDVRKVGQLVVVGQKHVAAELDGSGEMEGVGKPVPLRQSRRNGRIGMTAPDGTGAQVHCGSQFDRAQVWPAKESEKFR